MAKVVYGVVAGALITLVAGFFVRTSAIPLFVSIGLSVVAAVLVTAGWARRIRLEDDLLEHGEPEVEDLYYDDEEFETTRAIPAVRKARSGARAKPDLGRRTRTRTPPAEDDDLLEATSAIPVAAGKYRGKVVAIPGRGRYHRPSCRYAASDKGEELTMSAARSQGYKPCSVCFKAG